jgi:hypothetical protein
MSPTTKNVIDQFNMPRLLLSLESKVSPQVLPATPHTRSTQRMCQQPNSVENVLGQHGETRKKQSINGNKYLGNKYLHRDGVLVSHTHAVSALEVFQQIDSAFRPAFLHNRGSEKRKCPRLRVVPFVRTK